MDLSYKLNKGRYVILGDVHGCADEMFLLLDKVGLRKNDKLILAGDAINKGPKSKEVIDFLYNNNHVLVMGNHEWGHIHRFGAFNPLPADHEKWIRGSPFYYHFTSGGKNFTVVHAGIPHQSRTQTTERLYLRFEDEEGNPIPYPIEDTDTFWANRYNPKCYDKVGFVFFGHQAWESGLPEVFNYAAGIDGGCVYGGHLIAAVVDNGEILYYRQKSNKIYANPTGKLLESQSTVGIEDQIAAELRNRPWQTAGELQKSLGISDKSIAQQKILPKMVKSKDWLITSEGTGRSTRYAILGAKSEDD